MHTYKITGQYGPHWGIDYVAPAPRNVSVKLLVATKRKPMLYSSTCDSNYWSKNMIIYQSEKVWHLGR